MARAVAKRGRARRRRHFRGRHRIWIRAEPPYAETMSGAAVRAGESARAGAPDMSPLQRHVSYFDPAGTGKVRWGQTYHGLRDLGVGRFWSAVLTTIINVALGRVTGGGWLTIDIANIQRGKHDSDT